MDASVAARLKVNVDFQQCVVITVQKVLCVQKIYIFLEICYDRKFKTCWMHGRCFHFVSPIDV